MDRAVTATLSRIVVAKEYLEILNFLMRKFHESHQHQSFEEREEFSALRAWGYEQLSRAQSDLFMFNSVHISSKAMRAAQKEAFESFLADDCGVAGYLNKYRLLDSYGCYGNEKGLRKEIKAAKTRSEALRKIREKKEELEIEPDEGE
jgi:hypothetical protein